MTIFPDRALDPPKLSESIGLFGGMGFATVGLTNKLHNLPFFYRPHTHLVGIFCGCVGGYLIHTTAIWAQEQVLKAQIYQKKEHEKVKKKIEASLKDYEERLGVKMDKT